MMQKTALIQGATGGLGQALIHKVLASNAYDIVIVTARDPSRIVISDPRIRTIPLDLASDLSISAAARLVSDLTDAVHLVISTAGILKNENLRIIPEKKLAELNRKALETVFTINCFGPFLWYAAIHKLFKHRERIVIATLSARVGSIGDNSLGGWHSYRASKAAQNMLTKNLSLELGRSNPNAVVVGLHPGTVDTQLSKPFQAAVPTDKLFSPEQSATYLWSVIEGLESNQTGELIAWDGQIISR